MYQSQGGSAELANSAVCQSCGSVTVLYPEKSTGKKSGMAFVVFGWLFAAISFLFLPIVFGILALYMGFMTYIDRSKAHGAVLMAFAAVGLIFGSLISIVVAGTVFI
ncbi:hypothetical protein ABES03_14965 [Neobacillus rhizosphaerae]|uniref:hypothetical protein n=1 Tax=Neobacillus rhizosphaerae TaxID=2880965 RepID=UPI003D29E1F4